MQNKALLDLDIVVYRVGHACDNRYYQYMGERYSSRKELDLVLKDSNLDPESLFIERGTDPESWEDTQESVVSFVTDLLDGYSDYTGFLSGKGNFRYNVATILPYKGNRTAERPFHYDAIRQLLVDDFGAVLTEGMEADDALGLAQKEDSIILTIDKDLDMIPGYHYNWEKDLEYYVSELDGYRTFFKQMLTGDSTDNILGLYGVGPKSKLLKDIDGFFAVEDMIKHTYNHYLSRFGSYADTFFSENAKLLWILQEKANPIVQEEYWKV